MIVSDQETGSFWDPRREPEREQPKRREVVIAMRLTTRRANNNTVLNHPSSWMATSGMTDFAISHKC